MEKVAEKIGFDPFRNLARNERPAIAKDLSNIFDKYDSAKLTNSSLVSKGVSPPRHKAQPPISAKKPIQKSLEKNNFMQKSFERDFEEDKPIRRETYQNIPHFGKAQETLVEGDDNFAPLKVLSG